MKKPSFQFYPGDWRKDQNLSRASLSAKGALIEILCLAFECEKRGFLKTGKDAWSINEIAHAMGGDKTTNILAIEELLRLKILKKNKKNVIFSARMVRDEKLSKIRREAGFKGGNPNLVNQKSNQNPTPSSSSSSSSSNWESIKRNFLNDFRWKEKFCRDKNVIQVALEEKMNEFISDIELREDFKELSELKNHFTNLFNKNRNGKRKLGTSEAQLDALKNF